MVRRLLDQPRRLARAGQRQGRLLVHTQQGAGQATLDGAQDF